MRLAGYKGPIGNGAANANLFPNALSGYRAETRRSSGIEGSVMLFVDDHMAVLTQDKSMDLEIWSLQQ